MSNGSGKELFKNAIEHYRKKVAYIEQNFEHKTAELTQANELLKKQHETILKAEKMLSLSRLAAGFAHEINNPLTFISSNFELLKTHYNDEDALEQQELGEVLDDISEGLERIKSIINRINESVTTEFSERSPVNLNQAILSTVHVVRSRLIDSIKLDTQLEDIPNIFGDLNELKQVVLNLLINAIDAVNENKTADSEGKIRISTGHNEATKLVELKVNDNGAGINADDAKLIFEPFFTTKEINKGSGLGLFICHQIITAHQGQIDVDSIPKVGTTITITLPVDLRGEPR